MIGILVFPDFQLLDAAGPISVFEIAGRYAAAASSIKSDAIKLLAATPGPVRSTSGVELLARGLKPSGAIGTLIVAGGEAGRYCAVLGPCTGMGSQIVSREVGSPWPLTT